MRPWHFAGRKRLGPSDGPLGVLVGLLSLAVGLAALLALLGLDRWLRSLPAPDERGGVSHVFADDLTGAFSLKGATRRVGRAFWKAPLPLFVGGFVLTTLDNLPGASSAPLDGSFMGGRPEVDLPGGEWMIAALALGLSCLLVAAMLRAWLLPGWIRVQRAALVEGEASFATLGSGADRFLDVLGWRIARVLLLGLVFLSGAGPGLAIATTAPNLEHPVVVAGIGVSAAIQTVLVLWLAPAIALVERFLVLDGVGPVEALRRSWAAARGNRPTLILFGVASALALLVSAVIGSLVFCVGVLVTVPWTRALVDMLWTRAWLRARHGDSVEHAWKGTNAV